MLKQSKTSHVLVQRSLQRIHSLQNCQVRAPSKQSPL